MSNLEQLQADIERFLLSHEQLQYVSIVSVRPRSAAEAMGIQTKLNNTLAGLTERGGRKGMTVIIGMPTLDNVAANVRTIDGDAFITITVMEHIMTNMSAEGTGMSCEDTALLVAGLLNHQVFDPGDAIYSQPRLLTAAQEEVLDKKIVYQINMRVPMHSGKIDKVARPTVAQAGAAVSLSCTTEGAAILWTADGTLPGDYEGSTAQLYEAPFTLPPGTHEVRVAAYQSGMAGSHVVSAEVIVTETDTFPAVTSGTLVLRLEGDQITGLADGDPISVIPDSSGAGNHAAQASANKKPEFIASEPEFNGQPCWLMDGVDDGMVTECNLTNPYTLFYVGRSLASETKRHLQSRDANCLIAFNRDANAVYVEGDVVNNTKVHPGAGAAIGCLVIAATPPASQWFVDGVNRTDVTSIAGNWGRVALAGEGQSAAEAANCKQAAVLAFAGALSDADREAVQHYLDMKYFGGSKGL